MNKIQKSRASAHVLRKKVRLAHHATRTLTREPRARAAPEGAAPDRATPEGAAPAAVRQPPVAAPDAIGGELTR
jgi:hypothetical protein